MYRLFKWILLVFKPVVIRRIGKLHARFNPSSIAVITYEIKAYVDHVKSIAMKIPHVT